MFKVTRFGGEKQLCALHHVLLATQWHYVKHDLLYQMCKARYNNLEVCLLFVPRMTKRKPLRTAANIHELQVLNIHILESCSELVLFISSQACCGQHRTPYLSFHIQAMEMDHIKHMLTYNK